MQNDYIERFNRTFREDVLDAIIFENLDQMKGYIEKWMEDCNHHHSHESLDDMPPVEFKTTKSA